MLAFLWVLGASLLMLNVIADTPMLISLILNAMAKGLACFVLLHPIFRTLWGDAGDQFRTQAIVIVEKITEQTIRPPKLFVAHK